MRQESSYALWIIAIVAIVSLVVIFQSNNFSIESVESLGQATRIQYKSSSAPQPSCGDVNGDGAISVTDSLYISQASSGIRTLSAMQEARGDVNNDGIISASDSLLISRFAVRSDALLSCREGVPPTFTICTNTIDDDRDGAIDLNDPGCSSPSDNTEEGQTPRQTTIQTARLLCPTTAEVEWIDRGDADYFVIEGCTQTTCRSQDYYQVGIVREGNTYQRQLLVGQRISVRVKGWNQYGFGAASEPMLIVNNLGSCPGGPVRPGITGQYCQSSRPESGGYIYTMVVCWPAGHAGEACGPSGACLDRTACNPSTGICESRSCYGGCPAHSVCQSGRCVYDGRF